MTSLFDGARWAQVPTGATGDWPSGARGAVSLSFDVDADTPLYGEALDAGAPLDPARHLTALSDRQFGATRGLPRILDRLREHGLSATFFVPGRTARRYPEAVAAIVADGHEVGHHGDLHRLPQLLTDDELRRELADGFRALDDVAGVRPVGYRSPAWESSEALLDLLVEHEIAYDASLMGDDRPYGLRRAADGAYLTELPVHWSLDDWPYFPFGTAGRPVADAAACWVAAIDAAVADRRHVTLTMHPEVIGRAERLPALDAVLARVAAGDVWVAPLAEVARRVADGRPHDA